MATPRVRIDYGVRDDTRITRGQYMISLCSEQGDLHLLFEGPDAGVAVTLDELIAQLIDMRRKVVNRMAQAKA